MTWYNEVWTWLQETDPMVFWVVGIIVLIILYDQVKKWRIRKKEKKEEKKPEFEQYPQNNTHVEPMPAFDDIDFEKDLKDTEFLSQDNYNRLVAERNNLRKEIEEKKEQYNKAKERREKSLLIMKRIWNYVPELKRQEQILSEEIKRLEKK